jgi:hypothetical protein
LGGCSKAWIYIYIYPIHTKILKSNMAMYLFNYLSWDWKRVISMIQNYLSMKEGSLFVLFVLMRSIEPGYFKLHSWSLWKTLEEEGCIGLVSWCLDLQCRSSWILNDFFTKKKIVEELECAFGIVGKILMSRI